jgi:hypothetical protein
MEDDMLYWALVFFIIVDYCRFLRIWRRGGDRCQHRANTLLCVPGNLPDRPAHGGGRQAAAADLTARWLVKVPRRDLHQVPI